jgi:hypothetical protein
MVCSIQIQSKPQAQPTMIRPTTILLLWLTTAILPSCMVQTVTAEGGEVLYQKPVVGTPWESQQRINKQVEKTEHSLGVDGR